MKFSEVLTIILIILILAGLLVPAVDMAFAHDIYAGEGVVTGKTHVPEMSTIETYPNSDRTISVRPSYEPERWSIIVSYEGHTFSDQVPSDYWGILHDGDKCKVYKRVGLLNHGYQVKP